MLKLMKYEFRKMRTVLLIMVAALVALEAGFLIGDKIESLRLTGICLGLLTALVFAVYIYILFAGIISYSRELNDKTGYMTFMAPVSPLGVVVSKLLFTILAAVCVTALFGAAVYYDYALEFSRIEMDADIYRELDFAFTLFTGSMGGNITLMRVILNLALEAGTVLIEILLTLCTAYLSITLSATLLQNRKGFIRLALSAALFLGLSYLTSRVGDLVHHTETVDTTEQLLQMLGTQAGVDFAFAALFAGASAWLLDRKVSL